MRFPLPLLAGAVLAGLLACQINTVDCDQECQDTWMDGERVDDSSAAKLDVKHRYRVSARPDSLPQSVKDTLPVIIAAHGYTASTFEWLELRQYAKDDKPWVLSGPDTANNPKVLISLVLLGGHGLNIGDFQDSEWEDWGAPILAEYDTLVKLGYKNISLAGSSTGCPLILDHIARKRFKPAPNHVLLIDPIISPSAKMLSLIRVAGPILGNSPSDGTPEEEPHWYTNRPQETLNELYELTNLTKNRLESGIKLPLGTRAKVWKAKKDNLADPVSALLLYKGLRMATGGHIAVQMEDTKKHVFTRLHGRSPTSISPEDRKRQTDTFDEMMRLARKAP